MDNDFIKKDLLPINIGMTGHRDLRDEDIKSLEDSIRSVINKIKNDYKNSPIRILSPLADGADRLVAKIGLELGVSLYAILPMAKNEYIKDFNSEESKREFLFYCMNADKIIELPLANGNTKTMIKNYGKHRDLQYEQVGAYIVQHCQIFIALWNGINNNDIGGTASIVQFRLDGVPVNYTTKDSYLDKVDTGPVYHIFTPRKRKTKDVTINRHRPEIDCLIERNKYYDILYPSSLRLEAEYAGFDDTEIAKRAKNYYYRTLKRLDDFNLDVLTLLPDKVKEIEQSKSYVLNEKNIEKNISKILNYYAMADTLAIHFQSKTKKSIIKLIILAVSGFMFLSFFDELFNYIFILLLFPLSFLFAYLLYKSMVKRDYESKFYDYRALAEGLRVQLFWKLAFWEENVNEYYLRKFDGEIEWITIAILTISIDINAEITNIDEKRINKKLIFNKIYERWILDQKKYFKKRSNDKTKSVEKEKKVTALFFTSAMLCVIGFFILHGILLYKNGFSMGFFNMKPISDWKVYHIILVVIDLMMVLGAANATYVKTMIFAEEAKQYQRMCDIFYRGEKMVKNFIEKGDWGSAKEIILELGKEALSENGDWLLTQRSRPIEIPTG